MPLAERVARLIALEHGLTDHYEAERIAADHRLQVFTWRVRLRVPVYDLDYTLRIELEEAREVRVIAENWTGKLRHTYGRLQLCMWYPKDPLHRQWTRGDGLLKLVDTAVAHLFKELYFRETGEWLGEEVVHVSGKTEPRIHEFVA